MISQTAEYALRAMVWIAGRPEGYWSSAEISQATCVPTDYLLKILQSLGEKGLLDRKRGLKGGFKLARPSEKISILEIVQLFDPIRRIEKCPLGLKEHAQALCPLHKKLDDITKELICHFSTVFLSDLQAPGINLFARENNNQQEG